MTLDDALQQAKELIDTYEKVMDSKIPSSIKEAQSIGWDLVVDGIEIAALTHYDEDQRKKDRQRLVTLEGTLLVLEDLEHEIIQQEIASGRQIIYSAFQPWYSKAIVIIHDWAEDAIAALVVVGLAGFVGVLQQLLARLSLSMIQFVGAAQLAKGIGDGMKIRDASVKLMRQQALKQNPNAPRFRVKRQHRVA